MLGCLVLWPPRDLLQASSLRTGGQNKNRRSNLSTDQQPSFSNRQRRGWRVTLEEVLEEKVEDLVVLVLLDDGVVQPVDPAREAVDPR